MFNTAKPGTIRNGSLSDFWDDALKATGASDIVDTVKKTVDTYVPGASEYVDKAVQQGKNAATDAAKDAIKNVLPGQEQRQTVPTQTVPTQTAPTQTAPTQTTPTQTTPTQTAPTQTIRQNLVPNTTANSSALPASAPKVGAKLAPVVTGAIVGTLAGLIFKKPTWVIGGIVLGTIGHYSYRVDRQLPAA